MTADLRTEETKTSEDYEINMAQVATHIGDIMKKKFVEINVLDINLLKAYEQMLLGCSALDGDEEKRKEKQFIPNLVYMIRDIKRQFIGKVDDRFNEVVKKKSLTLETPVKDDTIEEEKKEDDINAMD